ncbi:MAG: hypothetical protein KHZ15_04795 [Coprobacillus cateniformis]|uniref:hypothetical protein n=1 Tax=Longibaculum muris TaxID=1796628 RepID=UPI003AB7784F|nr:hypothetical protein [Coprobacillus cateniformis]
MKEILQAYIYNEKMLNDLYQRAAALTCREDERQALLNFADHCHQITNELNQIYYEQFDDYYQPLIEEKNIQGTFRDVLNHIQTLEIGYYDTYRRHTYSNDPILKEAMREFADLKLVHTLAIMAMVIDMND